MNVLGLHPTSVEFFQRVGFSAEYLRTLDSFMSRQTYANELASLLQSAPSTVRLFLRDFGIEEEIGTVAKMLALHVLWQHYVTALDVPNLVENRPPSETNLLAFNYIDWLASAPDTSTIISEPFTGPAPAALLYALLRNALLLQLHHGAYEWLKVRSTFEPALEQSLVATTLPGIRGASTAVSKFELMAVPVEAVQANHPAPGANVADWIWRGSDASRGTKRRSSRRSATHWGSSPRRRPLGSSARSLSISTAATTGSTPGRPACSRSGSRASVVQVSTKDSDIPASISARMAGSRTSSRRRRRFFAARICPLRSARTMRGPLLEEDDGWCANAGHGTRSRAASSMRRR